MCKPLVALVLVGLLILGGLFAAFLYLKRKADREILRMHEYSINVNALIDESIPNLLNAIIKECFDDYKVMVLIPLNEGYITDQREVEIRTDLVNKVTERISPMAMDKLSLYYNMQKLGDILADKIFITVTNYVVDHNDEIRLKTN